MANIQTTNRTLELFRKEFGIWNVNCCGNYMVYNLINNRIAVQAEIRANKLIEKYGWQLTAKASKSPLSTLVIEAVNHNQAMNDRLNEICMGFERVSEMLYAENGVCHV